MKNNYEEIKIEEEISGIDMNAPRPNGTCQQWPPYGPCKPPEE